ncbi:NADH dehydrogenase [ubiquinone] 1 beta subcomplex subunit 9-like, partial [Quillaja saponaria]
EQRRQWPRDSERNERDIGCNILSSIKDTLNWAVHRHLFYKDASDLRERFEANRHVEDLDTIDRMIADGEAAYNKWRHPDPYIVPWAPGGSKFTRNPTPPSGIEIVYDYGREEND